MRWTGEVANTMCVQTQGALAVGLAALTATAKPALAASTRAKAHEWSCDERRPARRPPAACHPPDVFELGVPVEIQRAQPQLVDGQLAIEVIEIARGPLPCESMELARADPWDVAPGDTIPHGFAIARGLAWCDAIP
ncbi:MAG: hypothetical protein KIT31_38060 [Deltaproteobacteria bacterium]|nr:hypothetical protein [Deltaproteobacteria bacterium]